MNKETPSLLLIVTSLHVNVLMILNQVYMEHPTVFTYGGRVFQQAVSISVGSKSILVLTGVNLYSHNAEYI